MLNTAILERKNVSKDFRATSWRSRRFFRAVHRKLRPSEKVHYIKNLTCRLGLASIFKLNLLLNSDIGKVNIFEI